MDFAVIVLVTGLAIVGLGAGLGAWICGLDPESMLWGDD